MQQTELQSPESIVLADPGLTELAVRLEASHLSPQQCHEVGLLSEAVLEVTRLDTVDRDRVFVRTEDYLADISGTDWPNLNVQYAEASRLLGGVLFTKLSDLERAGQLDDARRLAAGLYQELFSSSPNIVSYSGSAREQFKLLALAQGTGLSHELARPMVGELAYNISFGYDEDIFSDVADGLQPTEQLQSIHVLQTTAQWGLNNGDWAMPAVRKVLAGLHVIANDDRNAILVQKVASASEQSLKRELGLDWVSLEDLPGQEQAQLVAGQRERQTVFEATQRQLGKEFPGLSLDESRGATWMPNSHLLQIAADCAAVVSGGDIGQMEQHTGNVTRLGVLDTVRGSSEFDLSAEQSLLLSELHRPLVRGLVEEELGVGLSEISLAAQVRLLEYMSAAQVNAYGRLVGVLQAVPEGDRTEVAEAFLALEFGDDFGDILLDVFEKDTEKALPLVRMIGGVRDAAQVLGDRFSSDDPLDAQLAHMVPLAFVKRTTELLALARLNGVSEVVESLEAVEYAARQIAGAVAHDSFQVAEAGVDYGTLRAMHRPVTITFRPSGDNARLGFTVRGMGKDGRQRLSIRLDYENGRLSLDMGSTAQRDVNASAIAQQVGSDLAKGELALATLRADPQLTHGVARHEAVLHGNHVREAFMRLPDLQPEEFSGVLHRFLYRLPMGGSTATGTGR